MGSGRQYRLIVMRNDGHELLLSDGTGTHRLLIADVNPNERFVAALTTAAFACLGCDLLYLFTDKSDRGDNDNSDPIDYCVLEPVAREVTFPTQHWVKITELSADDFDHAAEYDAVIMASARWRRESEISSGPFACPGWWTHLRPWIEGLLQPQGVQLLRVQQLNGSPHYCLLRITTTGGRFWFKAIGEPNTREHPITASLHKQRQPHVPNVVGTYSQWNGWLAQEAQGTSLHDAEVVHWVAAARALATLQISTILHTAPFQAAGAHSLTVEALKDAKSRFLETLFDVMGRQTKTSPAPLNQAEILLMGEKLRAAIMTIAHLQVPDALGHLDPNPGNIIVSSTNCTFLDWAESYVGLPFLSFQYLLEHFRRLHESCLTDVNEIEGAYWSCWRTVLPPESLNIARGLAPLLAAFAYAVVLIGNMPSHSENCIGQEAYLRSLGRRIKAESDGFSLMGYLCQA